MTEEIEFCLDSARESMNGSVEHLEREFQKIRAGKSSPAMLDGVKVDYYGSISPLSQVANVTTPDPRQIIVQAWDKSMLPVIEKAILAANLGFNPQNNGEILRIVVPPLTEQRRKELVKMAKTEAENCKVSIRNARRAANDEAKQLKKDGTPEDMVKKLEDDIQKITDDSIKKVDAIFADKEKDILTV